MTTPIQSAATTELGEEQLGLFLYQMVLIRRFEEKCGELYTKGKAEHDKRDTIKDREGKREVDRAMKSKNR